MLDLSDKQVILGKGVNRWSDEINQLYRPTSYFGQSSQELIYSRDNLNTTKFIPILLKEWFYLLKKNGYLVIDYKPNKVCDWRKLEENMWWLWKGKYEVIFHGAVDSNEVKNLEENKIKKFIKHYKECYHTNLDERTLLPKPLLTEIRSKTKDGYVRFICKKIVSTIIENDGIDKWTFGIITNGKKMDWMEQIIKSIRKQKIPHYEIVVCGTYLDRKEPDFVYIPFNQRDDLGWITKKKNIIVKNAQYENICILHDRLILTDDWYIQICKYGNCFEYLTCSQIFDGKYRAYDWLTAGGPMSEHYKIQMLDYRDWDKYAVIGGMVTITKKFFIDRIPWNESRFWNDCEDLELSSRYQEAGLIARVNPYAKIDSLGFRHGLIPTRRYFIHDTWMKIIPQDMYLRSILRICLSFLAKIPFLNKLIKVVFNKFVKNSWVYRIIIKSR